MGNICSEVPTNQNDGGTQQPRGLDQNRVVPFGAFDKTGGSGPMCSWRQSNLHFLDLEQVLQIEIFSRSVFTEVDFTIYVSLKVKWECGVLVPAGGFDCIRSSRGAPSIENIVLSSEETPEGVVKVFKCKLAKQSLTSDLSGAPARTEQIVELNLIQQPTFMGPNHFQFKDRCTGDSVIIKVVRLKNIREAGQANRRHRANRNAHSAPGSWKRNAKKACKGVDVHAYQAPAPSAPPLDWTNAVPRVYASNPGAADHDASQKEGEPSHDDDPIAPAQDPSPGAPCHSQPETEDAPPRGASAVRDSRGNRLRSLKTF